MNQISGFANYENYYHAECIGISTITFISIKREDHQNFDIKHDKVEHKLSFRNITENVIIGQLIGYLHHKIEFYKAVDITTRHDSYNNQNGR